MCHNNNSKTTNVTETKQKTVVQNEETSLICHICSEHYDTKEKLNKHTLTHSSAISQIFDALCLPENLIDTLTDVDCSQCTTAVIAEKRVIDEKTNKNATPRITENTLESDNAYDNSNEVNDNQLRSSLSGQKFMNNKDENLDLSEKEHTVARFVDKDNNIFVPPNAFTKGYSEIIERKNKYANHIDDTELSFVISKNDSKCVADKTAHLGNEFNMNMDLKIDDLEAFVCKNKFTDRPDQISMSEMISNTTASLNCEMLDETHSLKPDTNPKIRDISEQAMDPLELIETHADKRLNSCGVCKKVFTRKYSLDRHERNMHKLKVVKDRFNETDLHDNSSVVSIVNTAAVESVNDDHTTRRTLNVQYLLRTSRRDSKDKPSPTNAPKYAPDQHVLNDNIRRKKTYICYVCRLKAPSYSLLKDHMLIHADEKGFTCEICNRAFKRQQELNRHTRTVHAKNKPKKEIKCNICCKLFLRTRELARHTRVAHGEKKNTGFKCHICSRLFSRKLLYQRHLMMHTGEKPDPCPVCNKFFRGPKDLKVHVRTHEDKRYACEICGKKISTLDVLQKHLLIHTGGERNQVCDVCGERFMWPTSLYRHKQIHHGGKEYRCDFCNRASRVKGSLNDHMRGHFGLRKFPCSICNKLFITKKHLKNHVSTHSNDRCLKCKLCDKSFRQKVVLKYHMFSHTGYQPFSCDRCDKKFKRKEYLKTHLLIHEGKKPHRCVTWEYLQTENKFELAYKEASRKHMIVICLILREPLIKGLLSSIIHHHKSIVS